MSGVDGFSRIKYADDAANGDWSNVVDDILSEFFDDLRFTLDRDLQSSVPTLEEVSQKVEASYKDQMHETFLWRLGIPSELLMRVSKTSQSKALTDLLLQIALACNCKIHSAKARIPLRTGKFNFARIVKRLVKANATQSDLTWALRFDIWDTELRNELISSYLAFLQAAEKEADVTASELSAQARVNVDLRNKSYKRLFRGPVLWTKQLTVIRVSGLLGRESIIGNFIDRMIGSNTHAYSAPSPARKQSQVQLPVPLRNQCIAIFK